METLQIEKSNALKAFKDADASGRKLLTNLFGDKVLSLKAIDRIKTFEDACADQGVKPEDVLPFGNPNNDHDEALNAVAKMFVIVNALNGDWKADLHDKNQYKYNPWFKPAPSGSGLSYDGCGGWITYTFAGVRLCFKDAETAEYAGKQFIDIYSKFIL